MAADMVDVLVTCMPKRRQFGVAVPLCIWRLWVGYAAVPSMWMLALDTRRGRLSSPKKLQKVGRQPGHDPF